MEKKKGKKFKLTFKFWSLLQSCEITFTKPRWNHSSANFTHSSQPTDNAPSMQYRS